MKYLKYLENKETLFKEVGMGYVSKLLVDIDQNL